jgi:hypothetical protein
MRQGDMLALRFSDIDWMRQFRRINLHWHDLRHEYASRLVENGVPLAQVREKSTDRNRTQFAC